MKHNIIVKWKDRETNKRIEQIKAIFNETLSIPGIHEVTYTFNCIDRPNRYDLMITIDMDEEALAAYDASDPHHEWKETFGDLIEKKAIFDYQ
ncbi:Dabb family protein [Intestinibaculum porci]|jgi:hypothetical protein|uniref:Stress-response A/B barrel domain-containing protein n=1 Tax=Intestinibaculum porci TaxID=2487118 RepID=A0A3G9JVV7_9FIRM|nr:Dabb family protein [Intestinibaculum porci]MDD6348803.1 Dabb family protein [Intestinibaculum porci]BBH27169.1 hypothetical protein SG0102_21030 [Intestinibaculum porci]